MRHLRLALLVLAASAFAACTSFSTAPTTHDCSGYSTPDGHC
jgi:hypothetical protein